MNYSEIKNELDKVGCGFCLAKWTQVTIHLHLGRTHSCHHPDTHPIPVSELQNNPSALHNTRFKKKKRKEMLDGKRPSECQYCWGVEDNSNEFSDRIRKSSEDWSLPHINEIKNLDWKEDFNPRYVEVSFSNTCNFKCSYCGPSFSSSWVSEAEQYGAYPTNTHGLESLIAEGRMPFKKMDHNPYVETFWKWWPKLYRDLHTFRITGGEPLLSNDTWSILDYIIEEQDPNTKLSLAINSNLGVSDDLIDRLIDKVNRISNEERVKEFHIFTSVDGWGEQAEYGRHGLIFNKFWDNLNKILTKCPTVSLTIMSTYNVFSVPSYHKLIRGVYDLQKEHNNNKRYIGVNASHLRHPYHQSVKILPSSFGKLIKAHGELAETKLELDDDTDQVSPGFSEDSVSQIKRIYDWMISPQDSKQLFINRVNFYRFVTEHDRRRGTNFTKTFPELEKFYYQCKDKSIQYSPSGN